MHWNWTGFGRSLGTLSLGAALAYGGSALHRAAEPAPARIAPRIGVLNLGLALNSDPVTAKATAALEEWMSSQQAVIDQHDENVLKLQAEIEELREGSEQFIERAEELMLEKYRLELTVERMNAELKARQAKDFKAAYARIRVAAEKVRKDNALEVVLQVNPNPLNGRTSGDVISEIIARSTVVYDEQLDVTEAVIARLPRE